MRLPRMRFTVRRLMIAVAFLALFLGGWVWMERKSARFSDLANWHHSQITCIFDGCMGADGEFVYEATSLPQRDGDPPVSLRQQRIDTWHRQISMKYWAAARRPWLPVEPDPPEPE
jgi:hypothetical protein